MWLQLPLPCCSPPRFHQQWLLLQLTAISTYTLWVSARKGHLPCTCQFSALHSSKTPRESALSIFSSHSDPGSFPAESHPLRLPGAPAVIAGRASTLAEPTSVLQVPFLNMGGDFSLRRTTWPTCRGWGVGVAAAWACRLGVIGCGCRPGLQAGCRLEGGSRMWLQAGEPLLILHVPCINKSHQLHLWEISSF